MEKYNKEELEAIDRIAQVISGYVDYYTIIADTKPITEPEDREFEIKRHMFMVNALEYIYNKKIKTEDIPKLNFFLLNVLSIKNENNDSKYDTLIEDLNIKYGCKENVINIILGIFGAVITYNIEDSILEPILEKVIENFRLDQYLENTNDGKTKWLDYLKTFILKDINVFKESVDKMVKENNLGKWYLCWLFTKDNDEADTKYSLYFQIVTDKDLIELKGVKWNS